MPVYRFGDMVIDPQRYPWGLPALSEEGSESSDYTFVYKGYVVPQTTKSIEYYGAIESQTTKSIEYYGAIESQTTAEG